MDLLEPDLPLAGEGVRLERARTRAAIRWRFRRSVSAMATIASVFASTAAPPSQTSAPSAEALSSHRRAAS